MFKNKYKYDTFHYFFNFYTKILFFKNGFTFILNLSCKKTSKLLVLLYIKLIFLKDEFNSKFKSIVILKLFFMLQFLKKIQESCISSMIYFENKNKIMIFLSFFYFYIKIVLFKKWVWHKILDYNFKIIFEPANPTFVNSRSK